MEEKKPFASRVEAFFAGKGFYIVLFLCIAVIGVSAWSMLAGTDKSSAAPVTEIAVANVEDSVVSAAAPEIPAQSEPAALTLPEPTASAVKIPEAPVPAAETEIIPPVQPAAETAEERDYFIRPVAGEIENGYSMTALVFNRTMQDWRTHDGVDITAELGTQVKACANGRVEEIREDDLFGTTVVLSHRDGLMSIYSNLAAMPTVSVGDQVSVGQTIGAVGDTALGEAGEVCHLHFAMSLDGESVDPTEYLP